MDSESVLTQLVVIVLLIFGNAFFAASEIAIVSVRKSRIKQLAEEGSKPAQAVMRLTENSSRFLATIQIGVTLAGFFASAVGAASLAQVLAGALRASGIDFLVQGADAIALFVVTILIAYVTLILGELAPKNIALRNAEGFSLFAARPIEFLASITGPIVSLLTFSTNLVVRLFGVRERASMQTVTQEEILSMVDVGQQEGTIEPYEKQMIHGIFDIGDTLVREVMVPRIDMVALPQDTPVEEALDTFLRLGFSRLPIYEESIDNITGILYAKDLLRYFGGRARPDGIASLARPPIFVPETKRVSELFLELQQTRTQLVIVVEEYGGTAGLVTMEDLLEEIVGEIRDEYDIEESRIDVIGPNEVRANGLVSLADLGDVLGYRLEPEADVDTVAGLVYSTLGRIPLPGDKVEVGELTITVETVTRRRIRQVHVVRHGPREELEEG